MRKTLVEEIREYANQVLAKEAAFYEDSNDFPTNHMNFLFQKNVLDLLMSQDQGQSFKIFVRLVRIISKHFPAIGSILLTQACFGLWPIYAFGTKEQKESHLENLRLGKTYASFALNELDSGSRLEYLQTYAKKTKKGWILNGEKHYISNAPVANLFYIVAKIKESKEEQKYGIFMVERGTQGLTVGESIDKMGIKALPVSNLNLKDVLVSDQALLGNQLSAEIQIESTMNRIRLAIAGQAIGISQGSLERGLVFANSDRRLGQRLLHSQTIQFGFAEIQTNILAARALLLQVLDEYADSPDRVSMVKLLASRVAVESTEQIIQLTGGYGYMKQSEIERFVRDAKLTAIYGGSSVNQKRTIANSWLIPKKDGRINIYENE